MASFAWSRRPPEALRTGDREATATVDDTASGRS
jgi:hypothetical protein